MHTYKLTLEHKGCNSRHITTLLLHEILGYDANTAFDMTESLPVTVASHLSEKQAETLAEIMEEYGMSITFTAEEDHDNFLPARTNRSVFTAEGRLRRDIRLSMFTLCADNRIA